MQMAVRGIGVCVQPLPFQTVLLATLFLFAPPCSQENWLQYSFLSLEFLALTLNIFPIFSNSASVIFAFQDWFLLLKGSFVSSIPGINVNFCWIPSHVVIHGNEWACHASIFRSTCSLYLPETLPLITMFIFDKDSSLACRNPGLRIFGTLNYVVWNLPWVVRFLRVGWVAARWWHWFACISTILI